MKTTSLLTLTGVLSIGMLTFLKLDDRPTHKQANPAHINRVLLEPFKEHPFYPESTAFPAKETSLAHQKAAAHAKPAMADYCDDDTAGASALCLDDIVYLETEEPIELGFDVDEYLPADFDPYASASPDINLGNIQFIEDEEPVDLGFDTAQYLPEDFDPYAGMEPDLSEIVYIEEEEPVDLGFDTRVYLPEGFDPYAQPALQLEDIVYLEPEEPVELGFDVDEYLPADFNPYAAAAFDLDQIPYMEVQDGQIWDELKSLKTTSGIDF